MQRQHRDRLALELLRGASEEVLLRRVDRARWEKPATITAVLTRETDLHGIRGLVDPRSLVLAEDHAPQQPGFGGGQAPGQGALGPSPKVQA